MITEGKEITANILESAADIADDTVDAAATLVDATIDTAATVAMHATEVAAKFVSLPSAYVRHISAMLRGSGA